MDDWYIPEDKTVAAIKEFNFLMEFFECTAPEEFDGYVYIVELNGDYKIGYSKDPQKRVKEFSRIVLARNFNIEFSFPCKNAREAESEVHKTFAYKRLNGEWFALTKDELVFAKFAILIHSEQFPDSLLYGMSELTGSAIKVAD